MDQQKKILLGLTVIAFFLIGLLFFLFRNQHLASSKKKLSSSHSFSKKIPSNPTPDLSTNAEGLSRAVVLLSTEKGLIRFRLYPKDAPKTVHRIIELIQKAFYDGLIFHRVVPHFVIQTGDPKGDGTGGSGKTLPPEFNARKHVVGTVAMARASDPASADSQFYITLSPQPHLDGKYTVFGQVIDGFEILDQVQQGDHILWMSIQ